MLIALIILALCLFFIWSATDEHDRARRSLEDELLLRDTAAPYQSDPIATKIATEFHAARLIARR